MPLFGGEWSSGLQMGACADLKPAFIPESLITRDSHTHWDHKGDTASFPATTDLVVGPGTVDTFVNDRAGNTGLGGVEPHEIEYVAVHTSVANML